MEIISWNVNGIRSIYKKGKLDWFKKKKSDIFCLQEIRAKREDFPEEFLNFKNYHTYLHSASRKGYSGVAIYSKEKPKKVKKKIGLGRFNKEGRGLVLKYSDFTLASLYMPNGRRDKEDMGYKIKAYNSLFDYLKNLKDENIILVGDFNVAHKKIDLARPEDNKNNTMFTPQEREKIDKLLELGFKDSFRMLNKEREKYSWWPYWRNCRERNLGWRIDYAFVAEKLSSKVKDSFILDEVEGSDHCPVGVRL